MKKRVCSMILCCLLSISLVLPVFATEITEDNAVDTAISQDFSEEEIDDSEEVVLDDEISEEEFEESEEEILDEEISEEEFEESEEEVLDEEIPDEEFEEISAEVDEEVVEEATEEADEDFEEELPEEVIEAQLPPHSTINDAMPVELNSNYDIEWNNNTREYPYYAKFTINQAGSIRWCIKKLADDGNRLAINLYNSSRTRVWKGDCFNQVKRSDFYYDENVMPALPAGTYYFEIRPNNISVNDSFLVQFNLTIDNEDYPITYVLDGGKNNSANPATYKASSDTITLKDPSKSGFSFKGWYSDETFTNKVTGIPKGSFGNKTFYAKWEEVYTGYIIHFDGNKATSGTMEDMKNCKKNKTYTLSENQFERKGYKFVEWNTKKNGKGKNYKDQAKVKNLRKNPGSVITLYAIWKKIDTGYTIHLMPNKATSGHMLSLQNCKQGKTYTLYDNKYKRKGYTFNGWNRKADGSGKSFKNKAKVKNLASIGKTAYLYAQWKPISYSLGFNGNGSTSGKMETVKYKYGKKYTLKANAFTKKGYTFVGWNSKKDGSGKSFSDKQVVKNLTSKSGKKLTLYAMWEPAEYTVVLHGIDDFPTKRVTATYDKQAKLPYYDEIDGYFIDHWTTKQNGKGNSYQNGAHIKNLVDPNKKDKIDLYPVVRPIEYALEFEGNGATSGKMADANAKFNKEQRLPKNAFKRSGYKFVGWALFPEATASDIILRNNALFKNLTAMERSIITLYAVWEKK